jgi:hypothetical protein
MTNQLGTLNAELSTALRDPENKTWATEELDSLLTWACARMWPTVARRARESVTLVADQDQYALTDLTEINRVDVLDSTGKLIRILPGGTWEYWNDQETPGGTLYINPSYADDTCTLRVHGWAQYDLVENFPADRHVQYILALARAEACRREIARRSNSVTWQSVNQVQNISVNELVLMVNESDAETRSLKSELKTWRRPVPAHVG